MATGPRKRLWEEANSDDYGLRRASTTSLSHHSHGPPADGSPHSSTAPEPSEYSDRTLPLPNPLSPSSTTPKPGFDPSKWMNRPFQPTSHDRLDRRSHSLFDVFQERKRHRTGEEDSGLRSHAESALLHSDAFDTGHSARGPIGRHRGRPIPSLPSLTTSVSHGASASGNIPDAHALAGNAVCCTVDCIGSACSKTRAIARSLVVELTALDARFLSTIHGGDHPLKESPDVERCHTQQALEWALELVRWTNTRLSDPSARYTASQITPEYIASSSGQANLSATGETYEAAMKRRRELLEKPTDEDQDSPSNPRSASPSTFPGFPRLPGPQQMSEENRHRSYYTDHAPPHPGSPHRTASSSGSGFVQSQSPMQTAQSMRSGMLPSPTSMNFPAPSSTALPPLAPSTSYPSSAQTSHLQDLQHQVSVKTLALTTLQREYDALLQKLERQRTKCAALEKKFEVSDVEINSLTDEKELLQGTITQLEKQVEGLTASRDECQREMRRSGEQYMKIMEMGGKLQARAAEEKQVWLKEKEVFEKRVRVLEEAMVSDSRVPAVPSGEAGASETAGRGDLEAASDVDVGMSEARATAAEVSQAAPPASAAAAETISVLRAEITRLRRRTQTLETTLKAMRDESNGLHEALQAVAASGSKIQQAVASVLGGEQEQERGGAQ